MSSFTLAAPYRRVVNRFRSICYRSALRLLNPENLTTKSPRHEEIKKQFSFYVVSLCLGG